jgi:uncharacterized protein (DUF2225 family)
MRFYKNAAAITVCLIILVALAQPGATNTSTDVDVTCPLCHTNFKANVDTSSSRLGMRLDLKPIGTTNAPWNVPKCPKCNFIVYDQALSDEDSEHLIKFVNSIEYRDIAADNSTYFLLGRIYEAVGMDNNEIAHTYLKASWQVDKDKVKCAKYLAASLAKFEAFLSSNKKISAQSIMAEMVSGEIERRLGKFDLALNRFNRLQKTPEFAGSGTVVSIIEYQLELIGAKDTEPHEIK